MRLRKRKHVPARVEKPLTGTPKQCYGWDVKVDGKWHPALDRGHRPRVGGITQANGVRAARITAVRQGVAKRG